MIDVTLLPTDELLATLLADGDDLTDLELNVVAHTWAHDTAVAARHRGGRR